MKMRILFVLFLLAGCGVKILPDPEKPPVVPPVKPTTFSVAGSQIKIDGTLKAGAKVDADQAKKAVSVAVEILESK